MRSTIVNDIRKLKGFSKYRMAAELGLSNQTYLNQTKSKRVISFGALKELYRVAVDEPNPIDLRIFWDTFLDSLK